MKQNKILCLLLTFSLFLSYNTVILAQEKVGIANNNFYYSELTTVETIGNRNLNSNSVTYVNPIISNETFSYSNEYIYSDFIEVREFQSEMLQNNEKVTIINPLFNTKENLNRNNVQSSRINWSRHYGWAPGKRVFI